MLHPLLFGHLGVAHQSHLDDLHTYTTNLTQSFLPRGYSSSLVTKQISHALLSHAIWSPQPTHDHLILASLNLNTSSVKVSTASTQIPPLTISLKHPPLSTSADCPTSAKSSPTPTSAIITLKGSLPCTQCYQYFGDNTCQVLDLPKFLAHLKESITNKCNKFDQIKKPLECLKFFHSWNLRTIESLSKMLHAKCAVTSTVEYKSPKKNHCKFCSSLFCKDSLQISLHISFCT
jgi:hypothetical protein